MKGKKTLLRKYLWVSMGIISLSFIVLGSMIFIFITEYWRNEKEELFSKNVNYVANIASNNSYVKDNNITLINSDAVKIFMDTLSSNMNIDIFITDTNGDIILSSMYNRDGILYGKVPLNIMEHIFKGRYSGQNDLKGIYDSNRYIMGEPIYSIYGDSRTVIGAVFTVMDQSPLSQFKKDILKIFLFISIIAFIISFLAVRRLSYNIVIPLRQMSNIAISMANGDFSKRVEINGEDEISELGKSFNNMAESLYVSENVRKNFISDVSHELRTPMTTIAGFVDGILDGVIDKDKQDKYLKIVSTEIKRLSRLVQTMLDLSRMENKNIEVNPSKFDLSLIILNILFSFEDKILEKNIKIEGVEKLDKTFIFADKDMIYQAVYNLIENAVKFTNVSGSIYIGFKNNKDWITILIKNSGVGIPYNDLGFVFDRFYKTDKSRSKDRNGMGLGLYIVKRIISSHKGKISVSSIPGEITVFKIDLPKNN